jgi:ADP-ribose pyrophosphatase YjhB (NUDIX family)
MEYCSNCSHPVDYQAVEGDHRLRYVCNQCQTIHYQNPRIIVGCVPVWEGKVLLCRRGIEPQLGFWNLPGGFYEIGESLETGAMREAMEEAGLSMSIGKLIGMYSVLHAAQVHIHYEGILDHSKFHLTPESTEIQFFDESEIPWNELAFQSNTLSLKHYFECRKSDIWTTKRTEYYVNFEKED